MAQNEGVDESISGNFLYSEGRSASFQFSTKFNSNCEAHIYGTEGKMTLKFPFWCSKNLELKNGEIIEFPLPDGKHPWNFNNSAGLGFEAEHVRNCLLKGLKESPAVSHAETLVIAELMEKVRKQIGVTYEQD